MLIENRRRVFEELKTEKRKARMWASQPLHRQSGREILASPNGKFEPEGLSPGTGQGYADDWHGKRDKECAAC